MVYATCIVHFALCICKVLTLIIETKPLQIPNSSSSPTPSPHVHTHTHTHTHTQNTKPLGGADGLSSLNGIYVTKIGVQNIDVYFLAISNVSVTSSGALVRVGAGVMLCMLMGVALFT